MTHTRLWVVATIIAGIILVGFVLSVPHTRDILEPKPDTTPESAPQATVHDAYRKGVHTISGTIQAPNPCTALSATATVDTAAGADQIIVAVSMPKDTGICIQQMTALPYSVTVEAAASAQILLTVNGVTASTTEL